MPEPNTQQGRSRRNGDHTVGLPKKTSNVKELSPREFEVFNHLLDLFAEMGYCPSLKEIAERAGLSSPDHASQYVEKLEKKKHLTFTPGKARSIRILVKKPKAPKVTA
jgi:SOS-response transcriptional repressor LexA